MKKIVTVDSPARIHLGFLETNENSERKFGSIGLGISVIKIFLKLNFLIKKMLFVITKY